VRGERFALLPMPRFIELKLASGMAAPHRGKDLVDVQELIKSAGLPREVADELDPWVREKFLDLWQLAQVVDPF
jgi:SH3-like domain-containing protein